MIRIILIALITFSTFSSNAKAAKNHYWMIDPLKEYQAGEKLWQQQQYKQAYSRYADAKAAGHPQAYIVVALYYLQGLAGKTKSTAIAQAFIEEASDASSVLTVERLIRQRHTAEPTLGFNRLWPLLDSRR